MRVITVEMQGLMVKMFCKEMDFENPGYSDAVLCNAIQLALLPFQLYFSALQFLFEHIKSLNL